MTTNEILLSHGDDDEFMDYPIWAIVKSASETERIWLAGPWFNRPDAERHLNARQNVFGADAYVFSLSAAASWHMREIYRNARDSAGEIAP